MSSLGSVGLSSFACMYKAVDMISSGVYEVFTWERIAVQRCAPFLCLCNDCLRIGGTAHPTLDAVTCNLWVATIRAHVLRIGKKRCPRTGVTQLETQCTHSKVDNSKGRDLRVHQVQDLLVLHLNPDQFHCTVAVSLHCAKKTQMMFESMFIPSGLRSRCPANSVPKNLISNLSSAYLWMCPTHDAIFRTTVTFHWVTVLCHFVLNTKTAAFFKMRFKCHHNVIGLCRGPLSSTFSTLTEHTAQPRIEKESVCPWGRREHNRQDQWLQKKIRPATSMRRH